MYSIHPLLVPAGHPLFFRVPAAGNSGSFCFCFLFFVFFISQNRFPTTLGLMSCIAYFVFPIFFFGPLNWCVTHTHTHPMSLLFFFGGVVGVRRKTLGGKFYSILFFLFGYYYYSGRRRKERSQHFSISLTCKDVCVCVCVCVPCLNWAPFFSCLVTKFIHWTFLFRPQLPPWWCIAQHQYQGPADRYSHTKSIIKRMFLLIVCVCGCV